MKGLIERTELLEHSMPVREFMRNNPDLHVVSVNQIRKAPAVDAEPVRHGKWLEHTEPISWCEDDVDIFFACSICGDTMPCETNYCPNCGAKMDAEVQDETGIHL